MFLAIFLSIEQTDKLIHFIGDSYLFFVTTGT